MVCPHCATTTDVVNSRRQRRANGVWRRRKCSGCGTVFTTLEYTDLASILRVARSASELEPFSRDRLFISVFESCRHRSSAATDATGLTQQIISRLLAAQPQPGLIERNSIITATLDVLKTFDNAAAIHYEAYHPH